MKIPFRFQPTLFNTLFVAAEASLGSDVGAVSPGADSVIADSAVSSAAGETFGAEPQTGEQQVASSVITPNAESVPEQDIFEGVPSLEELQQQVEQKVPYSEALLRLRTELERVKPEVQKLEAWKPIVEANDPTRIQERLTAYDSIHAPKLVDGQPVLDDRNLPVTTAHPFLDQGEAKRQGYAMDHFLDVMEYAPVDPRTGQKGEPLISQLFHNVFGLDINRLPQYQNIDTLIAKSNGNITPEELNLIPETEREAYKTLPAVIRKDWEAMEEEERRYHLDNAKEKIESRQFRETARVEKQREDEKARQDFETQVQEDFTRDLATVRETAFSSLRDNLARQWQPSADDATNQDRYDDVLAPLVHLIDPDLQPMALKRLEREGIKVNAQEFNQNMSALVKARETMVRAKAYNAGDTLDLAERDFNRLHTQMMAKFNTIVLQRAQKYGMQAKQIAESKGELLTTASQIRPTVPGSSAQQQFAASGLPVGMDPRSSEAAMLQFKQSQGQAG